MEAIYAECVPVLISAGYVPPPFSDVLNWKAFSVQVEVKDIPHIKTILMAGYISKTVLEAVQESKTSSKTFFGECTS